METSPTPALGHSSRGDKRNCLLSGTQGPVEREAAESRKRLEDAEKKELEASQSEEEARRNLEESDQEAIQDASGTIVEKFR